MFIARFLLGAVLMVVGAFGLLFVNTAKADDEPTRAVEPFKGSWITFPGVFTKHLNASNKNHNERNYGIGIERRLFGRNWQIGTYHNSQFKNSSYISTELTSFRLSDTMRLRFNVGLVTGYEYAVTPMILPVWTYENRHWGFDILTIPSIGGRQGIFAIQAKIRF